MALDDIPPMTIRCATQAHVITDADCPHCRIRELEVQLGMSGSARIAMLSSRVEQLEAAASDWKRLAFDLIRAAGGTQRISMLTAMSAHTEDTLETYQDPETGDMVCRVYRAIPETGAKDDV